MVHDPSRRRRALDRLLMLGVQARQGQPTAGSAGAPSRVIVPTLPEHWTGQSAAGLAAAEAAPPEGSGRPRRRRKTDRP